MITITTIIYEKTLDVVLSDDFWLKDYYHPLVTKKCILVNNIKSFDKFSKLKDKYSDIYTFINCSDFIGEIKINLNMDLDPNDISYKYSLTHYTNLLCNEDNEFIFHVGEDCKIYSEDLTEFFNKSINILKTDPSVMNTTIFWNHDRHEEIGEHEQSFTTKRDNNFYMSRLFSDQVYFIYLKKMNNLEFNNDEYTICFPDHAGLSFERRLSEFYKKNNYVRGIFKSSDYYIHKSI